MASVSTCLLGSLLADPARARDLLVTRLHETWVQLVAPYWPRIRILLDRDIEERSRTLARHGLGWRRVTLSESVVPAVDAMMEVDAPPNSEMVARLKALGER